MAAFSRLCLLVIPVILLIASTEAFVLPRFGDVSPATLFGRQETLESPLCHPSCDLNTCGSRSSCSLGGISKRDWIDGLFFNSSDDNEDVRALGKRLFTVVPGSTAATDTRQNPNRGQVDRYLPAVAAGAENAYYGAPLPTIFNGGADERAVSQQRVFDGTPFQIMSSQVYGCTVIVVTSLRGVWMTHLWESYSNGKINSENPTGPGDPAFNQRVLMFLRGQTVNNPLPNGWNNYVAPTGPGIDPNLFNNGRKDRTEVFVFTPVPRGTIPVLQNLKYTARYGLHGEVRNAVADILGKNPACSIRPYVPLNPTIPDEERLLETTARGNVLFQYDPDSDGQGKRAWRLFMEGNVIYRNI